MTLKDYLLNDRTNFYRIINSYSENRRIQAKLDYLLDGEVLSSYEQRGVDMWQKEQQKNNRYLNCLKATPDWKTALQCYECDNGKAFNPNSDLSCMWISEFFRYLQFHICSENGIVLLDYKKNPIDYDREKAYHTKQMRDLTKLIKISNK